MTLPSVKFLQHWYLASWIVAVMLILPFNQRGTVAALIVATITAILFRIFDACKGFSPNLGMVFKPKFSTIILAIFAAIVIVHSLISANTYPSYLHLKAILLFLTFLITQNAVSYCKQFCLPVYSVLFMLILVPILIYLSWGTSSFDRVNSLPAFYNRIFVCLTLICFGLAGQAMSSNLSFSTKVLVCLGYVILTFSMALGSISETALLMCILGWILIGLFTLTKGKLCGLILFLTCLVPLLMPAIIFALDIGVEYLRDINIRLITHSSLDLRLDAWRISVNLLSEKPFFGWGMIPFNELQLQASENVFENGKYFELGHPHNGFIQMWVELGALGILAVSAVMVTAACRILKLSGNKLYFASALFVCAALVNSISHGAWQGWWIAEMILLAAMITGFYRIDDDAASFDPADQTTSM